MKESKAYCFVNVIASRFASSAYTVACLIKNNSKLCFVVLDTRSSSLNSLIHFSDNLHIVILIRYNIQ